MPRRPSIFAILICGLLAGCVSNPPLSCVDGELPPEVQSRKQMAPVPAWPAVTRPLVMELVLTNTETLERPAEIPAHQVRMLCASNLLGPWSPATPWITNSSNTAVVVEATASRKVIRTSCIVTTNLPHAFFKAETTGWSH